MKTMLRIFSAVLNQRLVDGIPIVHATCVGDMGCGLALAKLIKKEDSSNVAPDKAQPIIIKLTRMPEI